MGLDPLEEATLPLGSHSRALLGKLVLPAVPEMSTKTLILQSRPLIPAPKVPRWIR